MVSVCPSGDDAWPQSVRSQVGVSIEAPDCYNNVCMGRGGGGGGGVGGRWRGIYDPPATKRPLEFLPGSQIHPVALFNL